MRTSIFDVVVLSRRSVTTLCAVAFFISCVAFVDVSKLSRNKVVKVDVGATSLDDADDNSSGIYFTAF